MIDGIKIDVLPCNGCKWLDNKLLDFYTYTNTNTGELLDGTLVAKYRGLKFYITKSIKYNNRIYYSVRGSLHKYFNNGKHNANDFSFDNLLTVINELHQKFSIDPKTSSLRNVEFGVNITTPISVKEVLKNLVCYGSYTFGTLKIEGVTVGKKIDRQKNVLKIYDKGKQYKKEVYNLARIEIAVRKMVFLKPHGINKLSDLQNINKVEPLGKLLSTYWQDVIYYDKVVNWKQLTEFERKKLLYYATPRNWSEFDIKQRYRAKKHFKDLMSQFSTSNTHQIIGNLIAKKWSELTAEMCPRLNHDFKTNSKIEMSTFEPLEYTVHSWTNTTLRNEIKKGLKSTIKMNPILTPKTPIEKGRFCRVCANDIFHKKSNSLYCSKKCNNSFQALQRKKKRHHLKKSETLQLKNLLENLHQSNLLLLVEYRHKGNSYADSLYQNEITAPYNWTRKVLRVTELIKGIDLTSHRAKKFIHIISKSNKQ